MTLTHTQQERTITLTYPDRYTDENGAVYEVSRDNGTDDPREDHWYGVHAHIHAQAGCGYGRHGEEPEHEIGKAFLRFFESGVTSDRWDALELTERFIRIFHPGKYTVALYGARGYSQSDWWDLFIVGENDERYTYTAEDLHGYAREWEQWARGDVYYVSYSEPGEDGNYYGCGVIFADSPEEAVKYFIENYT